MPSKRDLVSVTNLFVPGQTVVMRVEAGDDIVVAVTVHVVGEHIRTARPREFDGMKLPDPPQRNWLLIPAVADDHVRATIAVDVTYAQAVPESLRRGD